MHRTGARQTDTLERTGAKQTDTVNRKEFYNMQAKTEDRTRVAKTNIQFTYSTCRTGVG